jgi:hypothetical protein
VSGGCGEVSAEVGGEFNGLLEESKGASLVRGRSELITSECSMTRQGRTGLSSNKDRLISLLCELARGLFCARSYIDIYIWYIVMALRRSTPPPSAQLSPAHLALLEYLALLVSEPS